MNQESPSPPSLRNILNEINSLSGYRRAEIIKQLGQMDLQIQDIPLEIHTALEKALLDPMPEVRKETIMALTFLEGNIAFPLIEPLLEDPEISVVGTVIAAIGFLKFNPSPELINKLIAFLSSPNPEIRDRTARAIGRLKIQSASESLINLASNDPSPVVRAGALVGLGMLGKNSDPSDQTLYYKLLQLLESETSHLVISAIKETLTIIKNPLDTDR
ncbi:HEAT repeat domain-containing protein [Candidatus Hodarchaeum mangrovi]